MIPRIRNSVYLAFNRTLLSRDPSKRQLATTTVSRTNGVTADRRHHRRNNNLTSFRMITRLITHQRVRLHLANVGHTIRTNRRAIKILPFTVRVGRPHPLRHRQLLTLRHLGGLTRNIFNRTVEHIQLQHGNFTRQAALRPMFRTNTDSRGLTSANLSRPLRRHMVRQRITLRVRRHLVIQRATPNRIHSRISTLNRNYSIRIQILGVNNGRFRLIRPQRNSHHVRITQRHTSLRAFTRRDTSRIPTSGAANTNSRRIRYTDHRDSAPQGISSDDK